MALRAEISEARPGLGETAGLIVEETDTKQRPPHMVGGRCIDHLFQSRLLSRVVAEGIRLFQRLGGLLFLRFVICEHPFVLRHRFRMLLAMVEDPRQQVAGVGSIRRLCEGRDLVQRPPRGQVILKNQAGESVVVESEIPIAAACPERLLGQRLHGFTCTAGLFRTQLHFSLPATGARRRLQLCRQRLTRLWMLFAPACEGRARACKLFCGFCKMLLGFGPELRGFGWFGTGLREYLEAERSMCYALAQECRWIICCRLSGTRRRCAEQGAANKKHRACSHGADLPTEGNASHSEDLMAKCGLRKARGRSLCLDTGPGTSHSESFADLGEREALPKGGNRHD